ncbi:MAG: FAD-dependent monooxygenase [Abitibacteriaceae bacterium]|nr:FAD-dependent monooxygenase [Abditibacteriaceae bacterium]
MVVIGAGIAGPCAALALARRGAKVALIEAGQLPRHKVCGEFLSPESQAVFTRLGVMEAINAGNPIPVSTGRILSRQGATLDTPLPSAGLALSRFRLDKILWDAACDAEVECFSHTRVRHIAGTLASGFTITTTTGELCARHVIAASGRHTPWLDNYDTTTSVIKDPANPQFKTQNSKLKTPRSAQFFGLKAHFRGTGIEPGVVELHGWRGGYCGLVQVEDGITNACLLGCYEIMKRQSQRTPEAFWQWLLQQSPALSARMQGATQQMDWLATGNIAFGQVRPTTGGILRCGDAAGFIDPLTGDGMVMAARSGELAAAVVGAQLSGDVRPIDMAPLYAAAWQREFSRRLHWAALLRPLLMSPVLTTPAIALLSRMPSLAQRTVANTRGL